MCDTCVRSVTSGHPAHPDYTHRRSSSHTNKTLPAKMVAKNEPPTPPHPPVHPRKTWRRTCGNTALSCTHVTHCATNTVSPHTNIKFRKLGVHIWTPKLAVLRSPSLFSVHSRKVGKWQLWSLQLMKCRSYRTNTHTLLMSPRWDTEQTIWGSILGPQRADCVYFFCPSDPHPTVFK